MYDDVKTRAQCDGAARDHNAIKLLSNIIIVIYIFDAPYAHHIAPRRAWKWKRKIGSGIVIEGSVASLEARNRFHPTNHSNYRTLRDLLFYRFSPKIR